MCRDFLSAIRGNNSCLDQLRRVLSWSMSLAGIHPRADTKRTRRAASLSRGSVLWDVDGFYYNHTRVRKLACIDIGEGMTGPQMVRFINALSSSIHQQSASGNFGVGAKIAAAPRNPHGLVYKNWKAGVGHMVHLWFDPDKQVYGLKRWSNNGAAERRLIVFIDARRACRNDDDRRAEETRRLRRTCSRCHPPYEPPPGT